MALEYRDNEDFLKWAQHLMADQTTSEFVPTPDDFSAQEKPLESVVGEAAPLTPGPEKPLTLSQIKYSLSEASEMHPEIRAVMSKALGDVIKLKVDEEKEKLYKELRETAESGVGGGGDNEHTSGGDGGGGGAAAAGDDNRYPVGALNRLNLNFLKVVKKHLVFTNTWNKFYEKQWRERGEKMKNAIVDYHNKICKRLDMFEQKYNMMQVVGLAALVKLPVTPLQKISG